MLRQFALSHLSNSALSDAAAGVVGGCGSIKSTQDPSDKAQVCYQISIS